MRLPERFSKTITIPVIVRNGQVTFLYGGNLPPLREGTEGKLIVPAEDVVDERWTVLLNLRVAVKFLPKGTVVGIIMKFDRAQDAINLGWLKDELKEAKAVIDGYYPVKICLPVKVCLQEDLYLEIRGTSKPRLLNCRCYIPALVKHEKQFVNSLNEAYTRISEVFEPTRRSHTGNIFSLCIVKLPTGWMLLDNLREVCEAEYARWLHENLRKIGVLPEPEACKEEIAQRIEQVLKQEFFAQSP